jgi:hypothetical protein
MSKEEETVRRVLLMALVLVVALGVTSGVFAWTHNEHIHNNTGETINDVHKVLKGRWLVDEMMTDTFPFAEWEQVFVGGGWETHLRWWGADVPTCQYAHVCFTIVDPITLEYAPGAEIRRGWWTRDGEFVSWLSPILSAGGEVDMGQFCLYLGNFSWQHMYLDSMPAPPVFVTDIAVAFVDECIPIEDLTYEVMYDPGSTLPWQLQPPMDLLVHGMWYQQICYPADSYWCIVRMTLVDGTDPNPYHEFMKFEVLPGGPSATEATTWGRLKGLFR